MLFEHLSQFSVLMLMNVYFDARQGSIVAQT
jgi:hypothetical protein